MSKSQIFIGIALSFSSGVLSVSVWPADAGYVYVFMGACLAGFGLAAVSNKRFHALAALFLFFAGLGALRLLSAEQPSQFEGLWGKKARLEGVIAEEPDIRQDKQLLTFKPYGYSQKILLTLPLGRDYYYGDWVLVEGKPAEPKNFEDFDYVNYLERFGIFSLMKYPKVLVLKNGSGNPVKAGLLEIKRVFAGRVSGLLPEPQSSLLLGILVGARKNMPSEVTENFRLTGTSHIVAISGFNITIIIAGLGHLARLAGRRASFWLSLFLILAFTVIAGASASVVRAAVMGLLLLVALSIGRQYFAAPALFFSGFIMVLLNPKILFWDVGFQLSFAATMGLVYLFPVLDKMTASWPNPWAAKDALLTTLSAIAATLPLVLFYFGKLSLVAPLANLLILPLMPLVMLLGALVVVPFLGAGFAFSCGLLLQYILGATSFFASLKHASLEVEISPPVFLALSFALALGCRLAYRRWAVRAKSIVETGAV